ncbi:MAG: type VI secretion system tube protein Hcp [Desulfobacteraceae bacterium]|jgi:type VI secretion system secreted protein Hcp
MAFDAFVQISGIEGESTDEKHPGWIEVITFDTEIRQKTSSTASSVGGGSSERADFKALTFSKLLDKASPQLALACAAGTHIDTIVIEIYRSGGERLKYTEYKLNNCLITRVVAAAEPGEFPAEIISVDFGKIVWTYTQQRRSGGTGAGQIAGGWDREKNCKV